MSEATNSDLYTLPEAAAQFRNVTIKNLRKWIGDGKLPYIIKPGGIRRYVLLADVRTLIEEHRTRINPCPGLGKTSSSKGATPRIGGGPGQSKVIDFEAARKNGTIKRLPGI